VSLFPFCPFLPHLEVSGKVGAVQQIGGTRLMASVPVNSDTIGLSIATKFTMSSNEVRALSVYP